MNRDGRFRIEFVVILGMGCILVGFACSRPNERLEPSAESQDAGESVQGSETAKASGEDSVPVIRFPNREYPQSIVDLLAHPEKFHGKPVQVEGFLIVEFEGTAIYLSRDDGMYGIRRNGVWVSFANESGNSWRDYQKFDKKFVLLKGEFDMTRLGHLGGYSGTIKRIDRIYELNRRPD